MIVHTASMMLLPGYLIELRDTTEYTEGNPFNHYGRAYFIKFGSDIIASVTKQPMADNLTIPFTMLGRHEGSVFYFPWWDDEETYNENDIVAYELPLGHVPGDPPVRGPIVNTIRLFKANTNTPSGNPMASADWDYLADDESDAFDECAAAGNKTLVVANVMTTTLLGENYVYKVDDFKYKVNLLSGGNYLVKVFSLQDLNNPLATYETSDSFEFDTKQITGQKYPLDVLLVSIEQDGNLFYAPVYEISILVRVVTNLVRLLYCIDSPDEDCSGITKKTEEKARRDMTSIMTLWQSLFYKINHSYAKSIFVGTLNENTITLMTEIRKEMNKLKTIIKNLGYDTGN